MRIRLGLAVLLLCAILPPHLGIAQPSLESDRVSGWLELLGKRIPLPPGEWRIASGGFGRAEGNAPGPYGAIGGVLLVRPIETPDHEFLLIHTNALPVRDGWGEPPGCAAPDALFADTAETRNRQNVCSFVAPFRTSRLMRLRLPALADARVERLLPSWALVAAFRVSDRSDMIEMWYGATPRIPDAAGWFRPEIELDGAYRAVIDRFGDWSEHARHVAIKSLRDPAPQVRPMPPLPLAGVVMEDTPPERSISTLQLALYKLATIQGFESAMTFALATAVSADPYIGVLQTFWQSWTHAAVYVGSEVAWEHPRANPVLRFVAVQPVAGTGGPLTDLAAPHPMTLAMQGGLLPLAPVAGSDQPRGNVVARGAPFIIDDKQVPMPAGSWRVLTRASDGDATGAALARIEDKSLVGLVINYTNPVRLDAIFGTSAECTRSDIVFSVIRYATPEDGYCSYGKKLVLDQTGADNALWQAALERLRLDGITLPSNVWMVGARARTRENFIDVRYYFAADQMTQRAGDEVARLGPDAAKSLETWADLIQSPLELGVRGRLPGSAAEVPWPWQTSAVTIATIGQTRGQIEALAALGALDGGTAAQQLALADAAMADREQQNWSLWARSAYKTLAFRVVSNVDTLGVSWFVTGSPVQSVAYTVLNQMFRPLILYVNEIGWARANVGKAPASLSSVTFAEIGQEQKP
jgi:hypothetical protein